MTEIVDTVTWALCSAHSASPDFCRCKINGSTIGLCSSTKRTAEIALSACRYHEIREALQQCVNVLTALADCDDLGPHVSPKAMGDHATRARAALSGGEK